MPALSDMTNNPGLGGALRRQIGEGLPQQARPAEYFGVKAVDWAATPADNLAALQAAADWSHNTGGLVLLPAGIIGIAGTLTMNPFARFIGAGTYNTQIRQLSIATDALGSYADVINTPDAASGGGAYSALVDLWVHGGWNMKAYEGVGGDPWAYDPAKMTQRGIHLRTPSGANGGPTGLAREGTQDPHFHVDGVYISNVAGNGIYAEGRGEMFITRVDVRRCGKHGMHFPSPDNWFSDVTIHETGDTGLVLDDGNQRLANVKCWFSGMQRSVEPTGAGLEIASVGDENIIGTNITTQDTYGPGMLLSGRAISIQGGIDHAGGGRLESQGNGFVAGGGGTRTLSRTSLRLPSLQNSNLDLTINGGDNTVAPPSLVDINNSGTQKIDVQLWVSSSATVASPDITVAAGFTNNKRFARIWRNHKLILGRVTTANLADALHGVNDSDGPSEVLLDPSGYATRGTGGGWLAHTDGTAITPA